MQGRELLLPELLLPERAPGRVLRLVRERGHRRRLLPERRPWLRWGLVRAPGLRRVRVPERGRRPLPLRRVPVRAQALQRVLEPVQVRRQARAPVLVRDWKPAAAQKLSLARVRLRRQLLEQAQAAPLEPVRPLEVVRQPEAVPQPEAVRQPLGPLPRLQPTQR